MKLLLTLSLTAAAVLVQAETRASRWWSHVQFLADDRLQGRDTGSEGHKTAVRYVAAEFEKAGLKAGGSDGYFQPVKFRSQRIDETASSIEIQVDGEWKRLELGRDAYFSLRSALAPSMEAGIVFAGYGFSVPEQSYDEFAGLDVKGKLVMHMSGGPKSLPGALMSHYQSADERWKKLQSLGAVGLISVYNPRSSDLPWARASAARLLPSMRLADVPSEGPRMNMSLNPDRVLDQLLSGSGHTSKELLDLATASAELPKFELKGRIRTQTKIDVSELESDNVAGILPGKNPALKNEYLVISAHVDHIGTAKGPGPDTIFNGAMDNASGIAALIEIARELHRKPLGRSVLFLAVTGEEKGLLGSQYFAHLPTVPREAIVGDLNFDMFLPLFPLKRIIVYGLEESTLSDTARRVIEKRGLTVMRDPQPARNSFIRSDQYSFIRAGVPALAFKFGYAPNSPEETTFKKWLAERYHALHDDLEQPVDRDAAAEFTQVMAGIAQAVANDPARPEWKASSFFKRFAR